jgi:hypothetical protein
MANARIPGPQGADDQTGSPQRFWALKDNSYRSDRPGPVGLREHRPIRVADAEGKDAKKPGKKNNPPPAAKTVHLHLYLDPTGSYSATSLFEFIRGPEDYNNPLNRWDEAGISLVSHTNVGSGADDFKKSLQDAGAVVVYLGHSALDFKNKRSMGLTPNAANAAFKVNQKTDDRFELANGDASTVIFPEH